MNITTRTCDASAGRDSSSSLLERRVEVEEELRDSRAHVAELSRGGVELRDEVIGVVGGIVDLRARKRQAGLEEPTGARIIFARTVLPRP